MDEIVVEGQDTVERKRGLLKRSVKIGPLKGPIWLMLILGCCLCTTLSTVMDSGLRNAGILPTYTPAPEPTDTPQPVPTSRPSPTHTPRPTNTPGPTNTPRPTNTPAPPTNTPSPRDEVLRIVEDTLGRSNRDVERVPYLWVDTDGWVRINWSINDAFSEDSIKKSAQIDITLVAEALCEAGHCDGLTMQGSFSLVDKFGNASETTVVEVIFSPETLRKINWDNFLFKNVYAVADTAKLHPAFKN